MIILFWGVRDLCVYVYSGLGNSERPHLVCYTYPRKLNLNTFEVDLLYMLDLITHNLIIDVEHVLITNVFFVPDDRGLCSINK